ncbi:MAG: vitamin K epoxide reductase family protein, partial [Anaerolineales bacterium]
NSMALNSENNTDDYRYTTSNESVDFYSKILLKFNQDVGGNSLAVIVLFLMVIGVIYGGITYVTDATIKPLQFPKWTIPLLTVAGLFIAVYLSYIEFTRSEAVCGPVGDCNTVQESPYAYLFGIVPIGLIGVVGYFSILIMWFLETFGPKSIRRFSSISVWLMALIGILFSIYLTFIEPFVIGATCAWCIASAIIMTLIFLASTQSLIEINPSK